MKFTRRRLLILTAALAAFIAFPKAGHRQSLAAAPAPIARQAEKPVAAMLEVAKVYGRAQGCSDASPEFIELTANAAIAAKLDPAIEAATVATESSCNPFAVSSKGAIGLMQVMPKIWKDKYDFTGEVNLLNRKDNLRVGAEIMAGLIQQYGKAKGVQRYNGAGIGCDTCDGGYASKILTLAHK